MKGYLVRVGIDRVYGRWNAPIDPVSCEFVYVPIPDNESKLYAQGLKREYREFLGPTMQFARNFPNALIERVILPNALLEMKVHLDPDFEFLTYGDNGQRRGAGISGLDHRDFIVFYAALRPITEQAGLIYALIGMFVVDEVVGASTVETIRRMENAHTRWNHVAEKDIVVRGLPGLSGRFDRCVPIGEFRDRAYRVRRDLESAWGGLSVKDGYIQRSAVPPSFLDPQRFLAWLSRQGVKFLQRNN